MAEKAKVGKMGRMLVCMQFSCPDRCHPMEGVGVFIEGKDQKTSVAFQSKIQQSASMCYVFIDFPVFLLAVGRDTKHK